MTLGLTSRPSYRRIRSTDSSFSGVERLLFGVPSVTQSHHTACHRLNSSTAGMRGATENGSRSYFVTSVSENGSSGPCSTSVTTVMRGIGQMSRSCLKATNTWSGTTYGGKYGRSTRGQHVLQLKHPIGPGVEITADYGPTYGYDVQGFSRSGHSTAACTTNSSNPGRASVNFVTSPTDVRTYRINDSNVMRRYPYRAAGPNEW